MTESAVEALEAPCRAIFTGLERPWEWDDRFGTVVLAFDSAEEQEILTALTETLVSAWTGSDIGTAPERVQQLADACGGLNPGQRFLHTDAEQPFVLFGMWWPWGNGKTISLRIGCTEDGLGEQLRSWFGID